MYTRRGWDIQRPRTWQALDLGEKGLARPGGGKEVSETAHAVLALILTLVLVCQVRAFAAVLRLRRVLATQRERQLTELVWVAIPVGVVLFLAARSWIVALDLDLAGGAPVEVSAQPSSPRILD
jgi:heme/copper-type cytochrome/quinol oxidase subunit 2